MSKPSDDVEGKPESPSRLLETNGRQQQPQSPTPRAGGQSPPLNGNGKDSNGNTSSSTMSIACGATASPPAVESENPISPRFFWGAKPSSTGRALSLPEANGSNAIMSVASQPSKAHHEGHSLPENPAAAKPVATTPGENEQPLKTIETPPVAAYSMPEHGKEVAEKPTLFIFQTEENFRTGTLQRKGGPKGTKSYSSIMHKKTNYQSESTVSLPPDSKGASSEAMNTEALRPPQSRSAANEWSRQTPTDSSETKAASIPSLNDEKGHKASSPRIQISIRARAPTPPSERTVTELDLLLPSKETLPSDVEIDDHLDSDKEAGKSAAMAKMTEDSSLFRNTLFRNEAWKRLRESDMANNKRRAAASKTARAPTPPSERSVAELDLLLPSKETLPSDVEIDDDLDSDKEAGKSAEMAKMTEDSSLFRNEAWKRLRESDMADNERRAAASKTAKSALMTLHKASAKYSASNAVPIPVPKPQQPQLTSPKAATTPILQPAPPSQLFMHQRMPLPSPPKHRPKAPPSAKKSYMEPKRAPHGRSPPGRAPPGLSSQQLAMRHPTIVSGQPMAPSRPHTGYVPRPGSSFTPYGKMPVKVTKEQIREAIPDNASCIFHILDRRVNLDSHAPDASFYSLLRSWVQDDPYRQMPPLGSNFLEYSTLPSERRVGMCASDYRAKRKLPDTGICDVFAELKNGKTPESELSPEKLREELVAGGKRIKRQRQKEHQIQAEASRESLRRMGIVLSKK